ncbi:MAG: SDH family Clp fold serine proteinase [bacterium]
MSDNRSASEDLVYSQVLEERNQGPATRQPILEQLERDRDRKAVLYFTSFRYPTLIEDTDADMLEAVLQQLDGDTQKGLSVILSSPGGLALAAERVIRVCRAYSNAGFEVIVPKMAKSAATMICLGASKIVMSETSELGGVDPQVVLREDNESLFMPAWCVLESYRDLFERAVNTTGNLEPFLQQLDKYDARLIKKWMLEQDLGKAIAVQALQNGMLRDMETQEVEKRIELLLSPEQMKSHGRPVYWETLKEMGLNIEYAEPDTPFWQRVSELYVRANQFVSHGACKLIETKDHHFAVPAPKGG